MFSARKKKIALARAYDILCKRCSHANGFFALSQLGQILCSNYADMFNYSKLYLDGIGEFKVPNYASVENLGISRRTWIKSLSADTNDLRSPAVKEMFVNLLLNACQARTILVVLFHDMKSRVLLERGTSLERLLLEDDLAGD